MKIGTKIIVFISLIICTLNTKADTITIDTKKQEAPFEGWGVSLCWWARMCGQWNDEKVEELVDWLVSKNGLNYNIFRYNIGGGDDPQNRHCTPHHMGKGKGLRAEMEGFKAGSEEPYNWEADAGQRRIMLIIKQKRPNAIFEAFSNSAPWWMTISGCVGGNKPATADNLRPDCYEAFAHYLVDVCKHYKEKYGIEFRTLEPFNEPVTNYWGQNGSQEGCHFGAKEQTDFIKVLYPILKESGLKTVISASDETNVETSIKTFETYKDKHVLPMIGQWNTHTYDGSIEAKKELRKITAEHGMKLWQSETGSGGHGIEGNLKMAQRLIEDIRCLKPSAWLDWQYVEQFNDQWSLVSTDKDWHQFTRHHNYYIRSMFSRFIKVGYRFIDSSSEHALAAISPNNKTMVLVTLNSTKEARTDTVILPKMKKVRVYRTSETENVVPTRDYTKEKNKLEIKLPPLSIVSMVIKL